MTDHDDFYCSGDCFKCERSGECVDEDQVTDEWGEALQQTDLPSCPTCGRLDCQGECKMLEPDPDEDPPLERDDVDDYSERRAELDHDVGEEMRRRG